MSFWLKVDPVNELDPGYVDPIQITPNTWNDASFFVDFNKDGNPRAFRLGAFADRAVWNPTKKEVPEPQRPLVPAKSHPFSKDKWTHVAFTWERFNTGKKDGVAMLYLNGKKGGQHHRLEPAIFMGVARSIDPDWPELHGLFSTSWPVSTAPFPRSRSSASTPNKPPWPSC